MFQFGDFELDSASFQLLCKGRPLRLERKPMELLILLVSRKGELVTRAEIAEKLWTTEVFVDTEHGINTAIRKLRHLLRDDADLPAFIQTVTGMGYRFVASVVPADREESTPRVPVSAQSAAIPSQPAPGQTSPANPAAGSSNTRWRWITAISAVPLIAIPLLLIRHPVATGHPLPKISRTLQLTSDGLEKFPIIVTDGVRIYFTELRNGHWAVCAVPVSGGEATAIPLPFPDGQMFNISPDKAELLVGEGQPISDVPVWVVPILGGTPHRLEGIVAHSAGWSPNRKNLVFMHREDVFLANPDGSSPKKIDLPPSANTWAWTPRWSPDQKRITFERYIMDKHLSSIWEISSNGEHPHPLLPGWQQPSMQCCLEWSPNGSFLVFDAWSSLEGGVPLAPAPDIWAIRAPTGSVDRTSDKPVQLTAGPVHFFSHVFGADGKSLFALSTQRHEELFRFDSKAKKFTPYSDLGPAHSISFSRDGSIAYTKFPQGELWRRRADGSESLQLTSRPLMAYGPEWCPDGKQIVFFGQEPGETYGLYLVSADGGPVRKIFQDPAASFFDPSWSFDGASIVFGSVTFAERKAEIEIFNLQSHQRSKLPGSEQLCWPRWSPDGKYISAISYEDELMLFDVSAKKWSPLLSHTQNQTWSKDSKSLYVIVSEPKPGIFRVTLADKKVRPVASLDGVHLSDSTGTPLFLTPQDEPLVSAETKLQTEIYALFWDEH